MTGNELMTGDIVDSNSSMIAQRLLDLGLSIQQKVTLADDLCLLSKKIESMTVSADVLIVNGGLGPTVDDLTAQALANACNVKLNESTAALQHLINWSNQKNYLLDQANLKQAMLPNGCEIIANRVGSAVGFKMRLNDCIVYCTPGVPSELNVMLEEQITPQLEVNLPNTNNYFVERLQIFGVGESKLQQLIIDNFPSWPDKIELGFRAAAPLLELKLTIKTSEDYDLLELWKKNLTQLLGSHILGEIVSTPLTMAEYVLNLLKSKNRSLTVAESCTGGLISSLITAVSGSSSAFEAGFVTYSNEMKSKMLGVDASTIGSYGAVSEQVVKEMALGALNNSNSDYTIAVSGIAGPDGGTKDKPVGSVWIAWGSSSKIHTRYFCLKGSRQYFQQMVATRALDLIRRELIECKKPPFYFEQAL